MVWMPALNLPGGAMSGPESLRRIVGSWVSRCEVGRRAKFFENLIGHTSCVTSGANSAWQMAGRGHCLGMSSSESGPAGPDLEKSLGIIAGSGMYPLLFIKAARAAGVKRLGAAMFEGETPTEVEGMVDVSKWMRVGHLGKLVRFFTENKITQAVMVGQIAPKNLFDLRPDIKAIMLLSRLQERNAESLFGAIADELENAGVRLLPATTFLEDALAAPGLFCGRPPRKRELADISLGWRIAKEVSGLDIGQTVILRQGTILAVEGFDGTNETIRRGGRLGRNEAIMVKVSKPRQDMRFDVPVIGRRTLEVAGESGIQIIAVEAGRTMLLEADALRDAAKQAGVTIWGVDESNCSQPS